MVKWYRLSRVYMEYGYMKKVWIIVIIALFGFSIIGGYVVLNNIFPKAPPINYPSAEEITTIQLIQNNDVSVMVESENIEELLQNISNAQPTRKMSVNDYPAAKNCYAIEIDTHEKEYRYFIYQEDSQVYIEIPYQGVYQASIQSLDFVREYFEG